MCFGGIPEGRGRRALSWRLMLNYLPDKKSTWSDCLISQRQLYSQLIEEIVYAQENITFMCIASAIKTNLYYNRLVNVIDEVGNYQ